MIFKSRVKEKIYKLKDKKDKKKKKIYKKLPLFFEYLFNGLLPFSPNLFFLLSISIGILFFILTLIFNGYFYIALFTGIMAVFVPYFTVASQMVIKRKLTEALEYKDFITILQSAIRSNNSTYEAINMISNEEGLAPNLKKQMQRIMSDIQLGDSIEEALQNSEDRVSNIYFKMALTIIRINHNVGSSLSINALNNISKTMNDSVDNLQLLRNKINSMLFEKTLFIILTIIIPSVHAVVFGQIVEMYYNLQTMRIATCGIMLICFAGQYIFDHIAIKLVKDL